MKTRTLMIVDPGLRLWGSERALAATLMALTEAWGRVVLITPPGAELAAEVRAHPDRYGPVTVHQAPIGMLHKRGRLAQLRASAALGLLMMRLRPARVYLNQAGLARVLRPVCLALGMPLAVHVRLVDDVPRMAALTGSARAPLDLIAVSRAMLDGADIDDGPHRQLHVAYDPYPLVDSPATGADPARPDFVSLGRLSHLKGVHLLVAALADSRLLQARVAIYGAGVEGDPYADDLAHQAAPLGGRIAFEGFRRDVQACLPGHRFLVLTSAYETLGRVVMEGWEAGLVPIVYTGSGGAAEMVRKSGAGLSFDDWTGEALADALVAAQQMPLEQHHAMVQAGRSWMAQNLGIDSYKQALSGVLF